MVILAEVLSIAILDNNKEALDWFSFDSPSVDALVQFRA